MQTKLAQFGEVVVVTINGRLDIDKAPPFKEACLKNLLDKKVVFNLQPMSFVGSTGIQSFFQVLKEIHAKNKFGVRIAGMTSDFMRLWTVHQDPALTIYDTTQTAVLSFSQPMQAVIVPPRIEITVEASPETTAEITSGPGTVSTSGSPEASVQALAAASAERIS